MRPKQSRSFAQAQVRQEGVFFAWFVVNLFSSKDNSMEEPVKVMVVDDQSLIREGIASLLAIQPGIEVCATAEDGPTAERLAAEKSPHVILMDIKMPGQDGIVTAGNILAKMPAVRILMLTTLEDDEFIVKSLTAGAVGYLLKDILAADLAQAVKMASRGIFQLAPTVAGRLIQLSGAGAGGVHTAVDDEYTGRVAQLTPRERDVLKLLASGSTNREIAAALYLSEGTVKNVISSIFTRLGIDDRVQAAAIAIKHGLT
jgi:DNA-binding NarL/FixJ family response regulator